jgi:DNA invertase Pin-like site-specific DNA recombinase
MQESELRDYCQRRQWAVVEVYQDIMSGAKDRRPALTRLMADARRGRFNVVCVYRLDRLGRSLGHLISTVNELHAHGVKFFSLSEQLDFTCPAGEFMFSVLGAVAQFERAIIRQRVKSGVDQARRAGKHLGRPRAVVDAGRIDSLRQAGMSWAQIGAELNQPATVCRRAHARFIALPKVLPEGLVSSPSAVAI